MSVTPAKLPDPLLLTIGEPGGIGPDLAIKLWAERHIRRTPPFILLGCEEFLAKRAARLGYEIKTTSWQSATANIDILFADALPVFPLQAKVIDAPGEIREQNSKAVIESIETAVQLIKQGQASAMVTNPINKKALYDVNFSYPGHTEFLGALASLWGGTYRPIMMLAGPQLKTIPATVHIPLKEVPNKLNITELTTLITLAAKELERRFAIEHPRIAVTGLNPHAGEEGTMGHEDKDIIQPAIEEARNLGISVSGPHPADTLFYEEKRQSYDVAIAMYHDQALLPVKTLAFDQTVNVTLGLPFIRTSPDHGTAFDLAGTNKARADSLLAALHMAEQMARHSLVSESLSETR